mgnify:CR=1 FL=1
MHIIGDYHTHSNFSHGQGDLKGNIETAARKGLDEIAITDHGPRTYNFIRLGIKEPDVLLEIKQKVKEIQREYSKLNVKVGVEANIINGKGELDIPSDILSELDLVAAGFHILIRLPDFNSWRRIKFDNRITYKIFPGIREKIRRWNTETVVKAVKKNEIDFITHPGYKVDIDTYELARVCAEEGTWLEINCRHGEMKKDFVRAARETEVKFIVNSDAHHPKKVGELEVGIRLIRELDLDWERVVNVKG